MSVQALTTRVAMYEALAKGISARIGDTGFRAEILEYLAATTRPAGNILQLEDLRRALAPLANGATTTLLRDAIARLAATTDLYFATSEHRRRFVGGEACIVTFVATTADEPFHQLIGFDQKGNRCTLDVNKPPVVPTLVVAACEHEGIHPQKPCVDCGGGGGGGGSTHVVNDLVLDQIVIYDAHEPWYKGDPEIMINVYKNTDKSKATWNLVDQHTDLPYVNETNRAYNPDAAIWNWNGGHTSGYVLVKVYEDDGPFDGPDHMAWFQVQRQFFQTEHVEPHQCRLFLHTHI